MSSDSTIRVPNIFLYSFLAACVMGFGWGYRGTVGHEAGAMIPGALLGMALCLGSGRLDWYRRTAVVGLFAAAGWAWGGSISYMEQTFYVQSDSFPDVLYGFTMLYFIGALWAGCGGALLSLGLTEPRSELNRLARPFAVLCTVYLIVHLIIILNPDLREANNTFTVRYFHDGDWLAATLALFVSAVYWKLRPEDRPATALFFWAAVAWWIGYGVLTQLLDIRLGPLHRSESWGGVLGILVALMVYIKRRNNRAAWMLSWYVIVGGGITYAAAVFLRHPGLVKWGPFAERPFWGGWAFSEVMYGFLMAIAVAIGVHRLMRGGLAPAKEDKPTPPLDAFAVFTILVALTWVNFRRHIVRFDRAHDWGDAPPLGIGTWGWAMIIGTALTIPALIMLYRYARGSRCCVPKTPFAKGLIVCLVVLWLCETAQVFLDDVEISWTSFGLWYRLPPVVLGTIMLGYYWTQSSRATVPAGATTAPDDPSWRVGKGFIVTCVISPVFLLLITGMALGMQDGPNGEHARKRFGPEAYWRQTARMLGQWEVMAVTANTEGDNAVTSDLPVTHFEFGIYRGVDATYPSGEREELHRWALKNQYIWLHWYSKDPENPAKAETPLQFRDDKLYIQWPPNGGGSYLQLQRTAE